MRPTRTPSRGPVGVGGAVRARVSSRRWESGGDPSGAPTHRPGGCARRGRDAYEPRSRVQRRRLPRRGAAAGPRGHPDCEATSVLGGGADRCPQGGEGLRGRRRRWGRAGLDRGTGRFYRRHAARASITATDHAKRLALETIRGDVSVRPHLWACGSWGGGPPPRLPRASRGARVVRRGGRTIGPVPRAPTCGAPPSHHTSPRPGSRPPAAPETPPHPRSADGGQSPGTGLFLTQPPAPHGWDRRGVLRKDDSEGLGAARATLLLPNVLSAPFTGKSRVTHITWSEPGEFPKIVFVTRI